MNTSVFVGLSGGVDSAVSAALLKQKGYHVVGCFIKIWQPEFLECTWREDRLDAMRVAVALGIPFREIDLSDLYKKEVVDSMVADYARGLTPNPDVLCNRSIKFGHFLRWACKEGADYIATGHYVRLREGADERATVELLRGKDSNKDQSYFLSQLRQEELLHALFPVGDLTKREVRMLAKHFGLPNAEKHDSQGLCFVGDVSMDEFLARFISLETGPVVDRSGNTIGTHKGAPLYTIGERHGFILKKGKGVHYVTAVDVSKNTIVVSPNRSDTERREIKVLNTHWIGKLPRFPWEGEVQARYREVPVRARMDSENQLIFEEPHLTSPGQSLVMYEGERCLGGGIIAL